MTKAGRMSESNQPDSLVTRLEIAVNGQPYYEIVEIILAQVDKPIDLAKCAELAARREPGGAYYRAKLWARAEAVRSQVEGEYGRKTLGLLCIEAKVGLSAAKSYIAQGQAITTVEFQNSQAEAVGGANIEDLPAILRQAPVAILQSALEQKGQATEYLLAAANLLAETPWTSAIKIHNKWCEVKGSRKANLDIIKPSDWWAFSHPKYRQEQDFPGSIPGEIYANSLYYFAPQKGVAVDSMAGSGMLKRVYEDRARWQKDSDFDLELQLFDLHPRRPFIEQHDARQPLPFKADWIFIDPPYFGQSKHLYNGDLAAVSDYRQYLSLLGEIVVASCESLNPKGRFCIFLPKWSGFKPPDINYDIPGDAHALAVQAGLTWIDAAYVSRGRQQEMGSAVKNNMAKRQRRMRSDTCVLNVFEKRGA